MSARSVKTETHRRLTSAQLEEQLVRRRQAEYERLNTWNNNSTYFKAWNFNTAQYANWTNLVFYSKRMENLKKTEMRRKKEEMLVERRRMLKELLGEEEKNFETELQNLSKKDDVSFEDLKCANMEILLREEEKRRRERDLKLYHHWRQNQPLLRDFETKQHYDFVKKSWVHQVLEKRKEREMEEKKALEYMENLKKLQEEQDRVQKEIEEDRKKWAEELKLYTEKQMEMIKCKEEQEKVLKQEEALILKAQAELEEWEMKERRRLEERKKMKDLSLFNRRQYQLMLKRRAQEVRDNIEADAKFLEKLSEKEQEMAKDRSERQKILRKELETGIEAFTKQAELEKLRMKKYDFLFEEEAKKMLMDQDTRWELEEKARNRFLNEILETWKAQVEEKRLKNLKLQEETRKCREDMIAAMQKEAERKLVEYRSKSKDSLDCWKKNLDQQVLEKKILLSEQKRKLEEDKEIQLRAMEKEEERLRQELFDMHISGYRAKNHGRRTLLPF